MIHRYTCDQTPRAPTRMQYVCVAATSLPTYDARARIDSMQSLEEPDQETRPASPPMRSRTSSPCATPSKQNMRNIADSPSTTQVHKLCQEAADRILDEFKPNLMIAIGGGGYVPARILRYLHLDTSQPERRRLTTPLVPSSRSPAAPTFPSKTSLD